MRYEDAAEHRTSIAGWVCKKCERYYGDNEHAARYCCCESRPCTTEGCENRRQKSWISCASCRHKHLVARFEALESKPYDGSPVVEYNGDRFMWDEDELYEYLDEDYGDLMLVFAEGRQPTWDCLGEYLSDDLPEDGLDTSEIDEQISQWLKENAPKMYWPSKVRVDLSKVEEVRNRQFGGEVQT